MTEQPHDGGVFVVNPSRAEIESLCIVHVASTGAHSFVELANSLGLSSELAGAMERAVAPLVEAGRLEVVEGRVRATELGRIWLKNRLTELDVR
jgi:hypothetical protein